MSAPATTPAVAPHDEAKKKPAHPPDRTREAIETIVFVVVLVLLLKLFVTEAFVIPTGSMAETLYGYQKIVTCPKCGHEFPVNSHDEVEGAADPNNPGGPRRHMVMVGYTCPNCRFHGRFPVQPDGKVDSPPNRTGDRVLVLKPIYHLREPERGDVVVFKYPEEPQQRQVAQNYIKRAEGFGGETVAIFRGDLYVTRSLDYPPDARDENGNLLYPRPGDPKELWRRDFMYANNHRAEDLFEASRAAGFTDKVPGGFQIVRKGPAQLLADRRIVWDNDQQPVELAGKVKPRWYAEPGAEAHWKGDNPDLPRVFAHNAGDLHWVRYRHFSDSWKSPETAAGAKPAHVDNFLGYNSEVSRDPQAPPQVESIPRGGNTDQWVGDLILECEAELGDDAAEVVLELSKGQSRFRAKFADGQVALSRTGASGGDIGKPRPCKVKGTGKYRLRFANVDCRLRVWVDDKLIDFGTDADYAPDGSSGRGWTEENDVAAPASIGAKGSVTVRSIKLDRDIFYTQGPGGTYLFYVQPGHYLCLGDNSAQSSDSRTWGLVPERLMLGKAVFVFWPFSIDAAKNRIGFIK